MAAEFEIRKSSAPGKFFWRLQADNNEILCHSEDMNSKQAAQKGAEAAKREAPTAPIRDKTGT